MEALSFSRKASVTECASSITDDQSEWWLDELSFGAEEMALHSRKSRTSSADLNKVFMSENASMTAPMRRRSNRPHICTVDFPGSTPNLTTNTPYVLPQKSGTQYLQPPHPIHHESSSSPSASPVPEILVARDRDAVWDRKDFLDENYAQQLRTHGSLRRSNSENFRHNLKPSDPQVRKDSFGDMAAWASWASFSNMNGKDVYQLTPEMDKLSYELNKKYFLEFILKDHEARAVFMQFLQMRHCAENLMFWLDVERYTRLIVEENRRTKAREIYEKYLAEGAPFEINISGSLKKEIEKRLLEGAAADVFLQAQKSIFLLMVEGTFDYFVKSERYCQLKEQKQTKEKAAKKKPTTTTSSRSLTAGANSPVSPRKRKKTNSQISGERKCVIS